MSKRKIKLPDNLGKLLIPKKSSIEKMQKRYPEKKYSVVVVTTADGKPLGFLVNKINKVAKTVL